MICLSFFVVKARWNNISKFKKLNIAINIPVMGTIKYSCLDFFVIVINQFISFLCWNYIVV